MALKHKKWSCPQASVGLIKDTRDEHMNFFLIVTSILLGLTLELLGRQVEVFLYLGEVSGGNMVQSAYYRY